MVTPSIGAGTLTIPVTVTVTSPVSGSSGLRSEPAAMQFSATAGSSALLPQKLTINSTPPLAVIGVQITYKNGAGWLAVSAPQSATPVDLTVTANAKGLTGGDYAASIVISSPPQGVLTIPVTLAVLPYALTTTPAAFDFNYQTGDLLPSRTLSLASSGGPLDFTVTAGANWLTVSPAGGKTPATLTVSLAPAGLATGKYSALVNVTSAAAAVPVQQLPVTLTVQQKPVLGVAPAVLNFAVFADGSVPPPQTLVVSDTANGSPQNVPVNVTVNAAGRRWTRSPTPPRWRRERWRQARS